MWQPGWAWALEGRGSFSSCGNNSSSSAGNKRRPAGTHFSRSSCNRSFRVFSIRSHGSASGSAPQAADVCCSESSRQQQEDQPGTTAAKTDTWSHKGGAPISQGRPHCQQAAAAAFKKTPHELQQLPDPFLFQQIQSCTTWGECLQLLSCHASSLDAMLLSALCTRAVYVYELEQYQTSQNTSAQGRLSPLASTGNPTATAAASSGSSKDSSGGHTETLATISSRAGQVPFLLQLSQFALALACTGTFRPQQYSNVLWCFARCGYRLPPWWTKQYLEQAMKQDLSTFPPRHLALLMWACGVLQADLPRTFLAAFLSASASTMPWFKAIDLANALWGLAALGVVPPQPWLHAALAAAGRCWQAFKPFELSTTVCSLAKLGVAFGGRDVWCIHYHQQHMHGDGGYGVQQQQQQGVQADSPVAAQHASQSRAAGGSGSSSGSGSYIQVPSGPSGFGWLLQAVVLLCPAMGLQEIANTLWGLAAGGAVLTQQQTEALGNQACVILAQSLPPSPALTASLAVSTHALTRLNWAPTLPQARILMRLLHEALRSGELSIKHACMLLHSVGRLRLRPPQPMMQQWMQSLQPGLQFVGLQGALQILSGCHRLGYRVPRAWWVQYYRDSVGSLREGNAAQLVYLLALIAQHRPLQPSRAWWEAFWEVLGVELETALAARGLTRVASRRSLPKGTITIAAAPLKALHKRNMRQLVQQRREAAARSGGSAWHSSGSRGSGSSNSSSGGGGGDAERDSAAAGNGTGPHPLAWLAMAEALQIVVLLRARAQEQQQQAASSSWQAQQQEDIRGMTPTRAIVLLWAAARLRFMPPKVLLWQLLLLVLHDVHTLSTQQLAMAVWAVACILHRFGRSQVECYKLIKPLALTAQWRLLTGTAVGGRAARRQLKTALWYLGSQDGRLMSLLLLHKRDRLAADPGMA